MLEFASVSASSKDPAALATTLTEKSADGWNVVSIVTTSSEVTAFLSRVAISAPVSAGTPASASASTMAYPTTAPAAEPAGWAVAPEPSPASAAMAPISTPAYQPAASSAPAVSAGWYADPAGRFDLRYWDGGAWTEHVSRAGQQYTDSPSA